MQTPRIIPPLGVAVGLIAGCGVVDAPPEATGMRAQRLVVASSPRCSVELRQISYDDPGSDDAEYVQLVVHGLQTPDAPTDAAAGGDAPDAAGDGGTGGTAPLPSCGAAPAVIGGVASETEGGVQGSPAPTLGDCGLETLDLLNGGVDGCPTYRSLDLTDTPVPPDGLVIICSEDSLLAAARCDVTHAGTRKLPNGWLQNGPSDGARFVGTDGRVTEIGYEGVGAGCFSGAPVLLVDESGEGPDGADDVNVSCGDAFELRSAAEVSPTIAPACAPQPAATLPDGAPVVQGNAALAASDGGEAAVTTMALGSGSLDETTTTEPGASLLPAPDAGATDGDATTPTPPSIGCATTAPWPARGNAASAAVLALAALAVVRRRVVSSGAARRARARR